MNSYMTAQAQKANEQTTFVINGEVSLFSNSTLQKEAASKIASAAMEWKDVPYKREIKEKLPSWFCFKQKKGKGTFIQSCFSKNQLDESGRRMGFQFFCDWEDEDIDKVFNELRKCAELAKRELDEDELKTLKEIKEEDKKKQFLVNVRTISLILLVILLIGVIIEFKTK
ncbi:MAG: hypothetical protein IKP37_09875 [Paludibacteraceae bacterium]|nr:hypothetical protein [Paludibacteraceae bacterium]